MTLKSSDDTGHSCLVPDLSRKTSEFFTVKYDGICTFLVNVLYPVEEVFLYS